MLRLNARQLETVSQWVMIAGIIALMQPWSHFLHRLSVTVILIGLVGFSVFSKFPAKPEAK